MRREPSVAAVLHAEPREQHPERATDLWQSLIAGSWSALHHFDADGRRFIVARHAKPAARNRGLTPAERRVACYAAWGYAQKRIALEEKVSAPAVSRRLTIALRKLGLRHRNELVALLGWRAPAQVRAPDESFALPAPRGLAAYAINSENQEFLVLSFDMPQVIPPPGLTPSESDIVRAVAEGLSNEQIATRRGTTHRTVANQLNTLFLKLQVSTRAELVLRCAGGA